MSADRDALLSDMKEWWVHGGGNVIDDSKEAIADAILTSDWLEGVKNAERERNMAAVCVCPHGEIRGHSQHHWSCPASKIVKP